jgi:hypothetical protein
MSSNSSRSTALLGSSPNAAHARFVHDDQAYVDQAKLPSNKAAITWVRTPRSTFFLFSRIESCQQKDEQTQSRRLFSP